ncbi:MAG TPA: hypothetical protein VE975_00660 [Actinomycetota bacterium]|jgi:predicted amidophosphoribosyltransferase|nr:hypothetical protein [Actinomycetota bacterium]
MLCKGCGAGLKSGPPSPRSCPLCGKPVDPERGAATARVRPPPARYQDEVRRLKDELRRLRSEGAEAV